MKKFVVIFIGLLFLAVIAGNAQKLKSYTSVNSNIPNNVVNSVCIDIYNNAWFGTNAGLALLKDTSWTVYLTSTTFAIADNQVNDIELEQILSADSNILWIGTSNGITQAVIDSSGITFVTSYFAGVSGNPMTNDQISSIAVGDSGIKYFGTLHGLGVLKENTWILLNEASDPDIGDFPITAIDANVDTAYVGMNGEDHMDYPVVYRVIDELDGFSSATANLNNYYTYPWNISSTNVFSVMVDADGYRWFGTDRGLTKHLTAGGKNDNLFYKAIDGLAGDTVLCINQDPDGAMWFGTTRGVSKMESAGSFENYHISDGLASDTVHDIEFAADGVVWFATHRGVSKLDGGTWHNYVNGIGKYNAIIFDLQISPNPARDFVKIKCTYPGQDNISISVYNQSGQLVKSLVSGYKISGNFELNWNLDNTNNVPLPAGLYTIRVNSNSGVSLRKLIILK